MPTDPGTRPDLLWLPVDKLAVDHRYQRTLESRRSQKLVEEIAANFRWSAFQAILATRGKQDGAYLVIDGQHRVEAARQVGIAEVPAVVVAAESLAEQAAAFVRANTDRVTVNAFALYHARLAAGDAEAQAVHRLCKASGIIIPRYPIPADKLLPGQTLALATIEKLPKKFGIAVAQLALKTVADAYQGRSGAVRAAVIQATALLLSRIAPDKLLSKAAGVRVALASRSDGDLRLKAMAKRHRFGGTEADGIVAQLEEDIRRAAVVPVAAGSAIRPLTREQLMRGR